MKKVKPITLDQLEKYLWGAAVLLRGSIDATSYKEYIFPLLFFKRTSDVWDEEYFQALQESGGDNEYAADAMHVVNIPEGAHWNDVRNITENVGQALVAAFKRIEDANPPLQIKDRTIGGLHGIFGSTKLWTNKHTMPDELISKLIEHFSKQTLSIAACPADEMGTGYEYLVGKFADDAGHTAQEFYTNRTVVDLMTHILKPHEDDSIYDPTCGSGGMLIKCLTALKEQKKEWRGVKVYGQELNAITASIARMNLFLHGVEDFTIINGDTLAKPAFIKNGKLQQFDIVLANPPYSIKQWNREAFASDIYGRNLWGTPPQGRADYAFFQHIVASMKPDTGRCAILFPHGVLFRDEEREMREKLLKADLVECVIGLGPNLFFNSPMESCIVICRTKKPKSRQNGVLFINAVDEVTRKNAQSYLDADHITKIVKSYEDGAKNNGFCKFVPLDELARNNYSLSIIRHTHNNKVDFSEQTIDFSDSLNEWSEAAEAVRSSYTDLMKMLEAQA